MAPARASCRLASIRQRSAQAEKEAAPHVAASSSSEPPGVSSGARPKREHRNRIKEDPVQYQLYREKENKRLQATRANRTADQKAEAQIKTRKPVQEWRLQQKMLGKAEKKPEERKKRAQIREKSERDGQRQQKYTASLPSQNKKSGKARSK